MINAFITENVSDDEATLLLMKYATLKKQGFGGLDIKVEAGRMVHMGVVFTENPMTFKKLYAGQQK
jgi:hypothetical protein